MAGPTATGVQHFPMQRRESAVPGREERTRVLLGEARSAAPERRQLLHGFVTLLHLDLAESIAERHRDQGVPVEDLFQAASEGLADSVSRFDPDSSDFLGLAVAAMDDEVRRCLRAHAATV